MGMRLLRRLQGTRTGGRLARCDRGQNVAEFALVLPLILVVFMGLVELGFAYDRVHGMAAISREGANIAARGTPLAETLDAAVLNGQTIGISTSGGVIASRIVVADGVAYIEEQLATDGFEQGSITWADQVRSEGFYLYSIGLGNPGASDPILVPDMDYLRLLSNEDGGTNSSQPAARAYFARSAAEFQEVFNRVAQDLLVRLAH